MKTKEKIIKILELIIIFIIGFIFAAMLFRQGYNDINYKHLEWGQSLKIGERNKDCIYYVKPIGINSAAMKKIICIKNEYE